ncbi:MAG TPA: proline dehydrogenase family protein [Propioniciclava tarda]|nr:proline dehydrogenase family protein [Propioniciclava tarda]HQA30909.1 proline dehydrogenase family protein [Propioniciclava tarda]HQD60375.1 proline dehydrogenase family protein [Propioniciclava tarda]
MLRTAMLAISRNETVRRGMVGFGPTKKVVDRFVAGETLDDCITAVGRLAASGLLATVDHLGEDTTTRDQADATAASYLDLLGRLAEAGLTASVEVSVKLTALGLALPGGREIATANAERICAAARAAGTTVTVDMEDHTVTDATLAVVDHLRETYPETGTVLQAYLHRTPDDCARYAVPGMRIRLCKGAYNEPASVAHRAKADVDAAYLDCLRILMKGDGYPMVASHDPRMIEAALAYADVAGRASDTFELQMLYGIRADEQARLAALGHRVRVYVPYGVDWYGYFTRRLAERPANMLFFGRALLGR